jgi:nifR3 family TIM-barrel protein
MNTDMITQRSVQASFWRALPKPFFVLAPMANVTDSVFRKLFAKYGKPDVTWTEFVSADGLVSPGRKILLNDLVYSEGERPIVAQLFTGHPEAMKAAAKLVAELGFDGLDINMGCPDRAVEKQGGGAANIKNPKNAVKVILMAREGVQEAIPIPVSVKTRLGYNSVDMGWIRTLLEMKLPVLTVHLRTRKEMSEVLAHWELMPEIMKMRDEISPETLIIGNGDVVSLEEAVEKTKKYGCDGVMVGRGIFGTPWFFDPEVKVKTPAERLKIMVEHAKLFEKTYKGIKNFATMKKHFKAYVSGWDGAKELRVKLMETENAKDVVKVVKEYLKEAKEI